MSERLTTETALAQLRDIKRIPSLSKGPENLIDFLKMVAKKAGMSQVGSHRFSEARDDLYPSQLHQIKMESPTQVLIVEGVPDSGKSYCLNGRADKVIDYYANRGRLYRGRDRLTYVKKYWEKDGEDRAREEDKITTPPGKPLPYEELTIVENYLQREVAERIEKVNVLELELPSDSATLREKLIIPEDLPLEVHENWAGRLTGSRLVYNLAHRLGPFADKSYELNLVVLIPGTNLMEAAQSYRYKRDKAKTEQQKEELARIYRRPNTRDGATQIEAMNIYRQRAFLEALHLKQGKLDRHFPASSSKYFAGLGLLELAEILMAPKRTDHFNEGVEVRAGFTLYHIKEVLNLREDRYFIGLNDPNFEEMGISMEEVSSWEHQMAA